MLEVEPFTVLLDEPLSTARGSIRERRGFLVRVEYKDTVGLGEATPLPGWTETYEECRDALERANTVASELDWGITLAKVDAPAARHGLSLALADARSKRDGEPLYRSLGGDYVEGVPVNATIGADANPESTATRAAEAVERGFRCLKIKVGTNGVEEDIERVRAVRNAVPEDIELRVDVNGAWTVREARAALEALAALDVSYAEQPLPAGNLSGHAQLRGGSVDIALDESLAVHDVATILDAEAADVLVLKPMVVGGIDRAREAVIVARETGVEPVISTTIDAVVARTGAIHLAASIPDVRPCGLATAELLATDLAPDPAPIRDGVAAVPQEYGIGTSQLT